MEAKPARNNLGKRKDARTSKRTILQRILKSVAAFIFLAYICLQCRIAWHALPPEQTSFFANELRLVAQTQRLVYLDGPWTPSIVSGALPPLDHGERGPDFGMVHRFIRKRQRKIQRKDAILHHRQRDAFLSEIDTFVSSHYDPYEDRDFKRQECRPPKWKYDLHPVCNLIHELSLERPPEDQEYSVEHLGNGLYREVYRFQQHNNDKDTPFVLKTLRPTENFRLDVVSTWYIRGEAMLLEQLSASPRLVNLYGYCSFTTLTQIGTTFDHSVVPMPNWQLRLHDERPPLPSAPNNPQLLPHAKLKLALEMAEGLAELHGFRQGVICHDDLSMSQWLWDEQGEAFLNDVNTIRVLEWNDDQNEYCPYTTLIKVGEYRPAESYLSNRTSLESDDMWSFGNILFSILTGVEPWIEKVDTQDARNAILRGEVPVLPPGMKESFSSPIEQQLMEIVSLCHRPSPDDRASIFTVLQHLRDAWQQFEEATTRKNEQLT